MDIHSSAAAAHVGSKRMFALFLDDNGNVGANLTGDGFRREVKIRGRWHAELHGAGHGFQFPVAVSARITLNGNAA